MNVRAEQYHYIPPYNREGDNSRKPIVDAIRNRGGVASLLPSELRGKLELDSVTIFDQAGESHVVNASLTMRLTGPKTAQVVLYRSDGNDGETAITGNLRYDGHTALVQIRRTGLAVVTLYQPDGDYDSGEYPGMTDPENIFVL